MCIRSGHQRISQNIIHNNNSINSVIISSLQDNCLILNHNVRLTEVFETPLKRQSAGTIFFPSLHCGVNLAKLDMNWEETIS